MLQTATSRHWYLPTSRKILNADAANDVRADSPFWLHRLWKTLLTCKVEPYAVLRIEAARSTQEKEAKTAARALGMTVWGPEDF
jgi:hypothetical protein